LIVWLDLWKGLMKKTTKFSHDGSDYILFQDLTGRYTLAIMNGDKYQLFTYKANNLEDLMQQYPFIKHAAKHFIFDEQMEDIIDGVK
jgi:hypothetical protein